MKQWLKSAVLVVVIAVINTDVLPTAPDFMKDELRPLELVALFASQVETTSFVHLAQFVAIGLNDTQNLEPICVAQEAREGEFLDRIASLCENKIFLKNFTQLCLLAYQINNLHSSVSKEEILRNIKKILDIIRYDKPHSLVELRSMARERTLDWRIAQLRQIVADL